jgi:hypothetical protein
MKRALARALAIGVGTTTLLLAVIGFGRTSTARPLLLAATRVAHGGCPFGYDKPMPPAERERARLGFAATHRGELRAASRPALGFTLDHTTRAEVVAQMAEHGIRCVAAKGLSDLTCNQVPSAALEGTTPYAPPRNLWLTFGTKAQLLSVIAVSRAPEAQPISDAFVATRSTLDRHAGAATQISGDANSRVLAAGLLHQASAEFRFSNYYAVTRATNLGKSFMFSEEYRSLPD